MKVWRTMRNSTAWLWFYPWHHIWVLGALSRLIPNHKAWCKPWNYQVWPKTNLPPIKLKTKQKKNPDGDVAGTHDGSCSSGTVVGVLDVRWATRGWIHPTKTGTGNSATLSDSFLCPEPMCGPWVRPHTGTDDFRAPPTKLLHHLGQVSNSGHSGTSLTWDIFHCHNWVGESLGHCFDVDGRSQQCNSASKEPKL